MAKRRIGILGYGKLGQFLVEKIKGDDGQKLTLELAFLWNRTPVKDDQNNLEGVTILDDLKNLENFQVDLIVEVCHPAIISSTGALLLQQSDLLVGSSTALVDDRLREQLQTTAIKANHRLIIARGALWAANDIQRIARQGLLKAVKVKMCFHPRSIRLPEDSPLKEVVDGLLKNFDQGEVSSKAVILYTGPVRGLCPLTPNNVNTMATAALLGVGFDRTEGVLVADPSLADHHRIEVEVTGVQRPEFSKSFSASSTRISPVSAETNVSSRQTLDAFWQSVLDALGILDADHGQIHVC